MGSGTSGVSREKGGGLKPGDVIGTTDMISARANFEENSVNSVLNVGRDMVDEYGEEIVAFEVADLKPNAQGVLGYYDGSNIAINSSFMNTARINDAYDTCVESGYHPSRGNKTAMEAVAAHEYGHALTDAAARKMGASDLNTAATQIVNEARKSTSHRGIVQMASKISRYATASNAEAVAEAISDVYCNGGKAKAESKAIVNVVNKYVKS